MLEAIGSVLIFIGVMCITCDYIKFISSDTKTPLDVIELELKRLHSNLSQFSWENGSKGDPEYIELLKEIGKLNDQLIELSKK